MSLYFLECRDSPRVFNSQFPFGTSGETNFLVSTLILPFTFPSLRFEYSVSVLEMPTRKLEERVACLFPSSLKATRYLVDDQR